MIFRGLCSDAIFQRLVEKHSTFMLARAVRLFNVGAVSNMSCSISPGHLFCLWLKPLNGQCIWATELEGSQSLSMFLLNDISCLMLMKITGGLPINNLHLSPHLQPRVRQLLLCGATRILSACCISGYIGGVPSCQGQRLAKHFVGLFRRY